MIEWPALVGIVGLAAGSALAVWALRERGRALRRADALDNEMRSLVQEASSQIAASEKRFRELARLAPVGIFEADEAGELVFASSRFAEIARCDRAGVLGKGWLEAAHPGDRARLAEEWMAAVDRAQPFDAEFRLSPSPEDEAQVAGRDSSREALRWVRVQATPRQVSLHGQVQIGTIADVTDRRREDDARARLERRVQQAQKTESLAVLAGGIAHDFNNLMVGVLSNAQELLRELPRDSPLREIAEGISDAGQGAADLASELLAFAGKGQTRIEPLDLSQHVRDMTRLLEASVTRGCSLELDLGESLPAIEIDLTHLRQVVMNLAANAADASPEDGRIAIRTRLHQADAEWLESCASGGDGPPGTYVVLEVADEGQGMEQALVDRVFDPFFTTKASGRGLGLAVVGGIVRARGGGVSVSTREGRGTTITVAFPASPRAAHTIEVEDVDWRGRGAALVVDDDDTARATTRSMLEPCGFDVRPAQNGPEAIALLRAEPNAFTVALLDYSMPDMNGAEVFAILRELRPDLPVVVVSGQAGGEVLDKFAPPGPDAFLGKPLQVEELLRTVRRVVEAS